MTTTAAEPVDALLVETFERLLAEACTPEEIERAESDRWSETVWKLLADSGFPWISVPEGAGGSGGTTADALAVLRSVGRHAAPMPVAETGLLGGWLAAAAGFEIDADPLTVVADPEALRLDGERLRGHATVAWAERSSRILGLVEGADGWLIVSVRPAQAAIQTGKNLAGEPRDRVSLDLGLAEVDHVVAPSGVDGQALRRRGALSRVVMSAGALEETSQLTVDYAHERRQFGRPVATFQAVQQHLVTAAQSAASCSIAADAAAGAVARGAGDFEVAAARVVMDKAIVEATRAAHQAHGAMGVTREYRLHHLSRRLWAWRHEYGNARFWRRWLGSAVVAGGADELFGTITR